MKFFRLMLFLLVLEVRLFQKLNVTNILYSTSLFVNDELWLRSDDIFVFDDGYKVSAKLGSLRPINYTGQRVSGRDSVGEFSSTKHHWNCVVRKCEVNTEVLFYENQNAVIFRQTYPSGLLNPNVGNGDWTVSGFPVFNVMEWDTKLGFVAPYGNMLKSFGKGRFDMIDFYQIRPGIDGGIIVFFNEAMNASIVMSSASNFMVSNMGKDAGSGTLYFGPLGTLQSLPKGFVHEVVVQLGSGVNDAVQKWGKLLLAKYNNTRPFNQEDLVLNYLGYFTDNGAYYYYNHEIDKNYEDTFLDLREYARNHDLPYRYLQLDSWFYYKDFNQAVTNWSAKPEVFPNGISHLHRATNWPIVAHNRYWSSHNIYAKQNGGGFDFITDSNDFAVPTNLSFWQFLLSNARDKWGLVTYEQDWLDVEFQNLQQMQTDAELGRLWLMQMGAAAKELGISIQYCMAWPRHLLQSVEIEAVTHARASDDYMVHMYNWRIGLNSMFISALGLAPFKDTFWSTKVQPGSAHFFAFEEHPEVQSLISSYSRGPVGPGDRMGLENRELIMRCCRSDGKLLRPDRPATPIDAWFIGQVFGKPAALQGDVDVWMSQTQLHNYTFNHLIVLRLNEQYDIQMENDCLVYQFPYKQRFSDKSSNAATIKFLKAGEMLSLQATQLSSPYVWHILENISSCEGAFLLGEMNKWVPVSRDRFKHVSGMGTQNLQILVQGAKNEIVDVYYVYDGKVNYSTVYFDSAGERDVILDFVTHHLIQQV